MPSPVWALALSTRGTQPVAPGESKASAWAWSTRVRSAAARLLAVGLVHDQHVGELENAFLDPLQLVACARLEQHREQVDHRVHLDLRLADADGLDDHDVEARRLADEHRLARAMGNTAERATRRCRTDVRAGLARQTLHARLVAEDASAGYGARRIDREHRDRLPRRDERQAERLDERALADARRTGDADADGVSGRGHQRVEHVLTELARGPHADSRAA